MRSYRLRKAKDLGWSDALKLEGLTAKRSGWYLIAFDNHCVAWDAENGVVHDPDPAYPCTIPVTPEGLRLLAIRDINRTI